MRDPNQVRLCKKKIINPKISNVPKLLLLLLLLSKSFADGEKTCEGNSPQADAWLKQHIAIVDIPKPEPWIYVWDPQELVLGGSSLEFPCETGAWSEDGLTQMEIFLHRDTHVPLGSMGTFVTLHPPAV